MDSRFDPGVDSTESTTSSSLGGRRDPVFRPLIEDESGSVSTAFSLPFLLGVFVASAAQMAEVDDSPSFSWSGAVSTSAPDLGINLNSEGSLDCCITLAGRQISTSPS